MASALHLIKKNFINAFKKKTPTQKARVIAYRNTESAVVRIENPTNVSRSRILGFKKKKGYCVYRVTVRKGMRARPKPDQGRKPGKSRKFKEPGFSWQEYAENKVLKKHDNLQVIGSYRIGEDGDTSFYEVLTKVKE